MGLTQQSQVTCNIKTDVTTSLYTTSIFAHYRTSESYIGSIPVNSSATAVLKSDLYPPKRLKSRHPVAPQLCVIAVHLRFCYYWRENQTSVSKQPPTWSQDTGFSCAGRRSRCTFPGETEPYLEPAPLGRGGTHWLALPSMEELVPTSHQVIQAGRTLPRSTFPRGTEPCLEPAPPGRGGRTLLPRSTFHGGIGPYLAPGSVAAGNTVVPSREGTRTSSLRHPRGDLTLPGTSFVLVTWCHPWRNWTLPRTSCPGNVVPSMEEGQTSLLHHT
ncbi:hypothetical protein E2C01_060294 [Portunus trituberculatus]|uniref:Uncharacterized protein n=1 Tax=Portunus trituberculatus TaxID=210409 RepID=A0A5B7H8H8_PORTR|nr:hypothetical protein [Portunus trituberculatus]